MKKYIVSVLSFFLLLSSCELTKEIDYESFYEGDKIIVHGFISPQNGVEVLVKKSVPPSSVLADDKIQHAMVTLYEDENPIQQLRKIDDYYYATALEFVPNVDKSYSIKIKAENFDEVSSDLQPVFAPVPIDSVKIIVEENTYYENLVVWFTNRTPFNGGYFLKVFYYTNGLVDSSYIGREMFNPYGLLDNIVVGQNSEELQLYVEFDSLKVELYTLSPDLTTFLESLQNYDSSREDPFFEQTYPVYSNIVSGYGIFASYSVCSEVVER